MTDTPNTPAIQTQESLPPIHSTAVIFNITDGTPEHLIHTPGDHHGHRERETIRLHNEALAKRVQRLRTDKGREISLRLPSGSPALRPGDVIAVTDTSFITIETTTTRVIVVRPSCIRQMGEAAHALGNRHRQVQFFDDSTQFGAQFGQVVFLTPYDHTVTDHLESLHVDYTIEDVELDTPFRHAEHQH
ncbi:urease accessory protein UreE [Dermatophilus congolensis]|uniref:urease accessory protein UreE n=1 Tax=Dermatophilus congolensis TaxID=1863 RepID=UPI001AAE3518|nr:urease accessory protein UreE [Dermatophilus congolensis]MBO3143834.1 urease accessory protein UreE [Dermatophilus congolensis]MBO3152825.1 urease accessory protein UreE [Dermatophilus congolensis]MBO3160165.1 urease accessory protein UreE [Dermatophilus congolensis]MBO3164110.1 urease accessory protein UreE [Dermatophilus congolensis]MBO3177656.1 urease accessory protein UreE [Dermatophilus congolensis]